MAEYSSNAAQQVPSNASIAFTETPVPCTRGFVRHRDGTGNFLLSGYVPYNYGRCNCNKENAATYLVDFGANVSIPEGGTVAPISVGISIDGSIIPSSIMTVTPAAVGDQFNISRAINVQIWRGCCENVSVVNVSNQAIQVQNANIIFARPDLNITR